MKPFHPTNNHPARHPFSLVEIMLALGVVAIGVISIMGLFPIGLNAARDTAAETYAANAAEEMLNYFKNRTLADQEEWKKYFGNESGKGIFSDTPQDTPLQDFGALNEGVPLSELTSFKKTPSPFNTPLYETEADNTFLLLNTWSSSEQDTVQHVDFSAVAKLWVEKDPDDLLCTLFTEISWPAVKPYAARTKKIYPITILNPYNKTFIRPLSPKTSQQSTEQGGNGP